MTTKQELEDSCNALEELKERATNLEQEIAELKAKGLLSISMRAYKDKLDKMQGCQKNDELLVEFFTMKEGRDISALSAVSNVLLRCMERNATDCAESEQALEHFSNVLKERLVGEDPIDLRGVGDLDHSFIPFKDRALALMRAKDGVDQKKRVFKLADSIGSSNKLDQLHSIIGNDTPRENIKYSSENREGSIYTPSSYSEAEYSDATGGEDIEKTPPQCEKRPRLKLGYHQTYKVDVYCFFSSNIEWATEMEVTQPPFGRIPQKERPLLGHCYGELSPIYEPFKTLLGDLNLNMTSKTGPIRNELTRRLREYYENQDILPVESWRARDRPSLTKARRAIKEPATAKITIEASAAKDLIIEWKSGRADYGKICEKAMADKVVAAYQALGKRAPTSDLVRLTASKISANYYDSDPSMVTEWQKWEARSKLQPAVEEEAE